jgi:hypothetical protein
MTSRAQTSLQAEVDRLTKEIATLKAGNNHAGEQITVGKYLLARLEQLGVTVNIRGFIGLSVLMNWL